MASVEIARLAREELAELVATRSLPDDTEGRVWRSLLTLEQFPLAGKALDGYWLGYRWVVGPWRWLLKRPASSTSATAFASAPASLRDGWSGRGSHAETVYEIAHRRLHRDDCAQGLII